jgi:CubicO group peptidase (beta-lactamase class C family)
VSTLEDLLLFDNALNTGKLVDQKLLSEAYTPAILNNGKNPNLGGVRTYGYGWNIMEERIRDRVIFHDGHITGLTTMLLKNPAKKLTIFYYDNRESRGFFQKVGNISRIMNSEPLNTIPLTKSAVRVFGDILVRKGLVEARSKLDALRADSLHYYFDELEMNSLGYDLLGKGLSPGHKSLSLDVFKMNTVFFPTHPNVYDSYAEALLKNGRKDDAILMYRKVLELDPNHQNAKKTLDLLSK